MQRHQRRRTRRVHRHRRTLQPERVGHPARQHASRGPGQQVALHILRRAGHVRAVVVVHQAHEHAGVTAAQGGRVQLGPLERLPARLQEQPLLRIHRNGLAWRDAEQLRIELVGIVQETSLAGVAPARTSWTGVVQRVDVPAAVRRERRDRVGAGGHQPPQVLRGGDPARIPAGHPDDRYRFRLGEGGGHGRGSHGAGGRGGLGVAGPAHLREQVVHQLRRCRVVEQQGGGHPQPRCHTQPVAQLHRGQRVEPERPERHVVTHDRRLGVSEHGGRLGAHQLAQHPLLVDRAERGQPALGARRVPTGGQVPAGLRPAPAGGRHQGAHHLRHIAGGGLLA